jgi:Protein of unknown function (DUF1064)
VAEETAGGGALLALHAPRGAWKESLSDTFSDLPRVYECSASGQTGTAGGIVRVGRPRSKYGAVKTTVDGIRFHSAKEARRYQELKLLVKAGHIDSLELQPRFLLSAWRNGRPVKLGEYVADFRYCLHGVVDGGVVEDVKGIKTALYKWKKKHVEAQYGIVIRET